MTEENVHKTCIEMLEQRGYTEIEQVDDDPIVLYALKKNGKDLFLIIDMKSKMNIERIRQYLGFINENECSHCIVVHNNSISPKARSAAEECPDKTIEMFSYLELAFNITKHESVPKHVKLTQKEAISFKKTYGTKFPTLRVDYPISRFYGYSKGDVVEITDFDDIIKYRIVR